MELHSPSFFFEIFHFLSMSISNHVSFHTFTITTPNLQNM